SHLKKNSVGPQQLKKNAVTTVKIKNGAVTGPKVDVASLGAVPNATNATHAATAGDASTLQGKSAAAFAQGNAEVLSTRRDLQVGDDVQLLALPGIGDLTFKCTMGTTFPNGQFFVNNHSGGVMDQTLEYPGGSDSAEVADGKSVSDGGEGTVAI